jgi:acyl-coenzyme A thioesterase PaaI-like protein
MVTNLEERVHILRELGFATCKVGEELHGSAHITPEMHAPGTAQLRTSILATWADTVAGLLASLAMGPRVPVTLELDVNLYRPAPGSGEVRVTGRTVKIGRSVFVAEMDFTVDDEPIASGAASFMVAPNPDVQLPEKLSIDLPPSRQQLTMPLAQRARCEHRGPGLVALPFADDGINASNTVHGGLIALVAEEALLTLAPLSSLSFLGLRYLQAARVGPVVASAGLRGRVGRVEVRDSGNENRLTTLVTAHTFGAD